MSNPKFFFLRASGPVGDGTRMFLENGTPLHGLTGFSLNEIDGLTLEFRFADLSEVNEPPIPPTKGNNAMNYTEIVARIAKLQIEAGQAKAKERAGVIDRIRVAIDAYGLTSADLFGTAKPKKPAKSAQGKRKAKKQGKAYADGNGNTWAGLGPRPAWLREELAAGRNLEEFRAG